MKNRDWKEVRLWDKNIIELIDGDRGVNYPKQEDFTQSGYCLFLSTANVRKDGFKFENCLFISDAKDKQLRKGKLNRNDIVLTTRGTIGNLGFYNDKIEYDNVRINSGMLIIRINQSEIDACFLYLLLRSQFIQEHINSFTSGTAQPQLPIRDLKNVKLTLPPLPTQQKIADILGAYDELIENNRRRMALLENMAAGLYKEWFVRMRPHGQTLPINSETGLPEGWEVKKLGSFGKIITGKTPSTENESYFGGEIPFVKTPDMHGNMYLFDTEDTLTEAGLNVIKSMTLQKDAICVNCIGALAGSVSITTKTCCTNQQIHSIVLKDLKNLEFAFFALRGLKEIIHLYGNTGSTTINLSKNKFSDLEIVYPNFEMLKRFNDIADPIFTQIKTLQEQTGVLRRMRDRLLPRLMSGELGE